MFGLERTYPHSFINDMNFLNRSIIDEMLASHGMTFDSFLAKSRRIINRKCYLAEPELYGSYVTQYHPDLYVMRHLSTCFDGRPHDDSVASVWDEKSIREHLASKTAEGFDVVAFHSWT
jgi:hypothetical protein